MSICLEFKANLSGGRESLPSSTSTISACKTSVFSGHSSGIDLLFSEHIKGYSLEPAEILALSNSRRYKQLPRLRPHSPPGSFHSLCIRFIHLAALI